MSPQLNVREALRTAPAWLLAEGAILTAESIVIPGPFLTRMSLCYCVFGNLRTRASWLTVAWKGAAGPSPNTVSGSVAGGGQVGGKACGSRGGPRDQDEGAGAAAEGGKAGLVGGLQGGSLRLSSSSWGPRCLGCVCLCGPVAPSAWLSSNAVCLPLTRTQEPACKLPGIVQRILCSRSFP